MDIRGIVKDWLEKNGYDGLFNPDVECGCGTDDFMPCDEPDIGSCEPGYKMPCPGPAECEAGGCGDWHYGAEKPGPTKIVVNGREREFGAGVISYDQVVELAFDAQAAASAVVFTMTYSGGPGGAEGTLCKGESVRVAAGMNLVVSLTGGA